MARKQNTKLVTNADLTDDIFGGYATDKERIKAVSNAYRNMSIAKAFAQFYSVSISNEVKANSMINTINEIVVGGIYTGIVKEISKNGIVFEVPGVKEEVICRENFNTCMENVENYLLNHDNKLLFEVREKKNNTYIVSVVNAYYKQWQRQVNKAIKNEDGIKVHIDELVRGGYVCHTEIWPLIELTGREYTSSVFIPGSHIVLNIERDFEKWIGEDVIIVPQKFVVFNTDYRTGLTENSLVGSRKRTLQIIGTQNLKNMYDDYVSRKKLAELADNVTVTQEAYEGVVTGIINSNKKTGAFVEITDKYITGLMPLDSADLLNYRPGDIVQIKVKEYEVQEGKEPFEIAYNKIKRCNVRPVFELA